MNRREQLLVAIQVEASQKLTLVLLAPSGRTRSRVNSVYTLGHDNSDAVTDVARDFSSDELKGLASLVVSVTGHPGPLLVFDMFT